MPGRGRARLGVLSGPRIWGQGRRFASLGEVRPGCVRQRTAPGVALAEPTTHGRMDESAACDARATGRKSTGFTLLELLVVLVLLGFLTALVGPNLQRLFASVSVTTERQHILDQFEALGRDALAHGRAYVVFDEAPDADSATAWVDFEPRVIDLPEAWRFRLDRPLVVRANGFCRGGELTLIHQGVPVVRATLAPPYCRAEVDGRS